MEQRVHLIGIIILGLSLVGFSGCGDGTSVVSSFQATASIEGEWVLKSFQNEEIPETSAATLIVEDLSATFLQQLDCSGAIKATVVSDSKLSLATASRTGCFVEFLRDVEINRSRIIDSLREGATFELQADSTLTLQSETGTLVFAPVQ